MRNAITCKGMRNEACWRQEKTPLTLLTLREAYLLVARLGFRRAADGAQGFHADQAAERAHHAPVAAERAARGVVGAADARLGGDERALVRGEDGEVPRRHRHPGPVEHRELRGMDALDAARRRPEPA